MEEIMEEKTELERLAEEALALSIAGLTNFVQLGGLFKKAFELIPLASDRKEWVENHFGRAYYGGVFNLIRAFEVFGQRKVPVPTVSPDAFFLVTNQIETETTETAEAGMITVNGKLMSIKNMTDNDIKRLEKAEEEIAKLKADRKSSNTEIVNQAEKIQALQEQLRIARNTQDKKKTAEMEQELRNTKAELQRIKREVAAAKATEEVTLKRTSVALAHKLHSAAEDFALLSQKLDKLPDDDIGYTNKLIKSLEEHLNRYEELLGIRK